MATILAKRKKIEEIDCEGKFQIEEKKITLKEHTEGLLFQLKSLLKKVKKIEDYKKHLYFSTLFHDIGKVSPTFQLTLKNLEYEPKGLFPDIPHSLFSVFWLDEEASSKEFKEDSKFVLSAIAFHHWRESFYEILLGTNKDFKRALKTLLEDKDLVNALLNNIKENLSDINNEFLNFIKFNESFSKMIVAGGNFFSYLIPPYSIYFMPQRFEFNEEQKRKWIFVAGLLTKSRIC